MPGAGALSRLTLLLLFLLLTTLPAMPAPSVQAAASDDWLTAFEEVYDTIVPGGASLTIFLSASQNANITFNGTQNQRSACASPM